MLTTIRRGMVGTALVLAGAIAVGADSGAGSATTPAKPAAQTKPAAWAPTAPWVLIPDTAIQAKKGDKPISAKAICAFGVDPTNGDIIAVLWNKGGAIRSEDQGASFKDYAGIHVGQCPAYPASINVDPAGKRMAVFTIVDGLGAMTTDAGKTWTDFKGETDVKSVKGLGRCFDFGAVDWDGGGKAIIASIHESKGKVVLSTDGGETWKELGAGYADKGPIGIVDEKTLLTTKGKVLSRSTDGGATWTKVMDVVSGGPKSPCNPVMYFVKGTGYWMTENGLLVSKDKGATWAVQGSAVKANIGPLFGKDENHMAAVGAEGVYETKDGGKEWKLVAPPSGLGSYAWDPVHDIFYSAGYGKGAVKCVVGK